ncbi:MAG: helix-turn-helix transcriptional regulator [Akkermansiaceae bacterium]|nr:helix-turn-helix transcriptional regulator [Akkermansiaceae bacterium]
MSWPSYPAHNYERRKKFGIYLEPTEASRVWGLRVHGVGSFTSRANDISASGRVIDIYALVFVRAGSGFLRDRNGKDTSLNAGDVLVVTPGWWHLYNPDKSSGWATAWVLFDGSVAEALEQSGELKAGVLPTGPGDAGSKALEAILDGMIGLATHRADTQELQARMAAEMLGLLARLSDWKARQTRGGALDQISEAIKHVDENYPGDIDFDALLEKSGMSYTHFRRQFKTATGDGPQAYQQRLRVRLAKELLSHTELPVAEIGRQVGYQNAAYFSRVFRNRVGVSPAVWRGTSF